MANSDTSSFVADYGNILFHWRKRVDKSMSWRIQQMWLWLKKSCWKSLQWALRMFTEGAWKDEWANGRTRSSNYGKRRIKLDRGNNFYSCCKCCQFVLYWVWELQIAFEISVYPCKKDHSTYQKVKGKKKEKMIFFA